MKVMKVAIVLILVVFHLQDTNGIFLGEKVKYKGKEMEMDANFNITLMWQATIPRSLRLNSVCQVPDAQLTSFNSEVERLHNSNNNNNNNANKRTAAYEAEGHFVRMAPKQRVARDVSDECKYGSGCTGVGIAGGSVCIGSRADFVGEDCLKSLWQGSQQRLASASQKVLQESKDFTDNAIKNAVNGIETTLNTAMDGLNSALASSITKNEATLSQAISDSSAAITSSMNDKLDELRQKTSDVLGKLQKNTDENFAKTNMRVSSVAASLTAITKSLEKAIISSNAETHKRVTTIAEYIETFINVVNTNSLANQDSINEIMKSVQQLTVRAKRAETFEYQGIDVSSLLALWHSLNDTENIFMDPTNNTYKYVSPSMIGIYDATSIDYVYPYENDVEGKYAYKCWERAAPTASFQSRTVKVTLNKYFYCVFDNPYQQFLNLFTDKCSNSDYLAEVYKNLTDSKSVYEIILESSTVTGSMYDSIAFYGKDKEFYGGIHIFRDDARSSGKTGDACIGNFTYTPINDETKIFPDTKNYVTLLSNQRGTLLENVTPDSTFFSYATKDVLTARNVLENYKVLPDCNTKVITFEVENNIPSIETVLYGKNHFYISHPELGSVQIHRCELVNTTNYNPITDYNGTLSDAFVVTDGNGIIMPGGYQNKFGGKQTIPAYGSNIGGGVDLLVRQSAADGNPILGMEPDTFYYSADIWCCENSTKTPILTVDAAWECGRLGYQTCGSALFGNCTLLSGTSSGASQLRKLVRDGSAAPWRCPSGYSSVPRGNITMYKSPRIYYCTEDRKYREPYGVEIIFCTQGEIGLPGPGVTLETGIMAPGGLYPATCIFYNSAVGSVPLYTIKAGFEDKIVPVMLNDLSEKKIAFYWDTKETIDEMDRLYGEENNGYDCVRYEMNRLLHSPSNCINFDIPVYSTAAYFSSRVRTTGISKLFDLFEVTPYPIEGSKDIILNFNLKQGVDYSAALVDNVNNCPNLKVEYVQKPSGCLLSGWNTIGNPNVIVEVANTKVCTGAGLCISSLHVSDNTELYVTIHDSEGSTNCSKFRCLASRGMFVAYPVDSFDSTVQRPYESMFIKSTVLELNYTETVDGIVGNLTTNLLTRLNNSVVIQTAQTISTDVVFQVTYPNLTATLNTIQEDTKQTIQTLNQQVNNTKNNVSTIASEIRDEMSKSFLESYASTLDELNSIFAEYSDFETQEHIGTSGFIAILEGLKSLLVVILVAVAAAVTFANLLLIYKFYFYFFGTILSCITCGKAKVIKPAATSKDVELDTKPAPKPADSTIIVSSGEGSTNSGETLVGSSSGSGENLVGSSSGSSSKPPAKEKSINKFLSALTNSGKSKRRDTGDVLLETVNAPSSATKENEEIEDLGDNDFESGIMTNKV